jgi:hypothetical protein
MGKSIEGDGGVHKKQFNSPLMIPAQELRADGYLNGNWILFEYDTKTRITHNFSDGIVAEGANDLK